MPRVLPSELNGRWFKMKSEKRCEVNEFHTPVSLKTLFWPSSHSDWGWRVGNRAMLIRRSQKGVLWCYALPYTCEFTEQGCSRAETFFLLFFPLSPFARSSVVDLNAVSYLTQLPRTITLTLAGLTLINTVFFTQTAGQCWRWLYFCCWNWAISDGGDEAWAVWYKPAKVTRRSLLVLTLVGLAQHK